MQLIAPKTQKTFGRAALSAFAIVAVAATGAFAHPHDDDAERKSARDKIVEKIVRDTQRQTVRVIQEAKRANVHGRHIEIVPEIRQEIRFAQMGEIEDALEDVRDALSEVKDRRKAAKNKRDKKALEAAETSLEKAIEALEKQKENGHPRVTAFNMDIPGPDFDFSALTNRRLFLEFEREAIEDALEGLDDEAESLVDSRQEMLEELAEAREEIAEEIQELEIEIEDGEDHQVIRLRALRDAELAIADMEGQHLAALKAAEKELKRARERLEKQLRRKEERAKREAEREKKREERKREKRKRD